MSNVSRRDFLKLSTDILLTLGGLLGLGGLIKFLSYQFDPAAPTEFDIGLATDYADGTRTVVANIPAIIIHDEKGFTAISLVCTHLGCTVDQSSQGFACPCHGSQYDKNGLVTRGPAVQPLKHLRVEQSDDGHLHVYTN